MFKKSYSPAITHWKKLKLTYLMCCLIEDRPWQGGITTGGVSFIYMEECIGNSLWNNISTVFQVIFMICRYKFPHFMTSLWQEYSGHNMLVLRGFTLLARVANWRNKLTPMITYLSKKISSLSDEKCWGIYYSKFSGKM